MVTILLSSLSGPAGNFLGRNNRHPLNSDFVPTYDFHSQFERAASGRKTYVCFQFVSLCGGVKNAIRCSGDVVADRQGLRKKSYVNGPHNSQLTVAFASSVQPEINRALQYVDLDKSEEEKVWLGEDEMGWCRKGKFQQLRSTVHAQWLAQPVPAFSSNGEQTRTAEAHWLAL
jgi:hypothetical protein